MPPLKEITSAVDKLQPTDRGVDAFAAAGRRIGGFYNQAAGAIKSGAEAVFQGVSDIGKSFSGVAKSATDALEQQEDYAGHRAIAQGAAASSKLFSTLTDQLDNVVKTAAKNDPNDTSVAAKFREQTLEPALQNFKEAYSGTDLGSKWAEAHVETMRNHFYQKSAADMATLAGKAVETNLKQMGNEDANSAYKDPSFHTVDFLLDNTTSKVGAIVSSSNVKGTEAARIQNELTEKNREQIVRAAAASAIAKSPTPEKTAQDFADRYPQYMPASEAISFAKAAKTQEKANRLADKQLETVQRQLADLNVHKQANKLMADNVSVDETTGRMIIKPGYFNAALDIARNNPDAPSARTVADSAISWGEHQQDRKAQPTVDNPAVKEALYTGLFDPDKPTTMVDLQKANIKGDITTHTYTAMHQLLTTLEETPLKGEVFKDTLAAVKGVLSYSMPGMPGRDPKGLQNYSAFVQQFIPQYIAASKAGTLKPNALDTRDPTSMISQAMAPLKRTWKQLADDRAQEMATLGDKNLTGDNKTITGVETIDQPPGAKTFVPPNNWQFSASTKQYRDPSGAIYDISGKKIEKAAPSAPRS